MQARAAAALAELRAISCSFPMTPPHYHCWCGDEQQGGVKLQPETARAHPRQQRFLTSAWHACTLFSAHSTAPMVGNGTTRMGYVRYAWVETKGAGWETENAASGRGVTWVKVTFCFGTDTIDLLATSQRVGLLQMGFGARIAGGRDGVLSVCVSALLVDTRLMQ